MRPRQSITEVFSSFVQFVEDDFSSWVTDPKLRRSMLNRLEQLPESKNSEKFWVLYWHKIWLASRTSLAAAHLSAYLQETCFWAAYKTMTRFTSVQYSLSDRFQMALTQSNRVFKGFNPDQGSSLKNYASIAFFSAIRDTLRQRREGEICTDWALLCKLTPKRLVESLQNAGLSADKIARCRLAWTCFKTLFVPTPATGMRQLPKPDPATWEAIAKLYNVERKNQLSTPGAECSPETLIQWLSNCAKWARSYLYPQITSLNVPQSEEGSRELQDSLPFSHESLLTEAIAQEEAQNRKTRQAQISSVLEAAIAKFNPQIQEILQLYYGQDLTQQQIAQQLEMKQCTVSRRLTKTRESLQKAMLQWSQETLKVSLSSEVIKQISAVLEEWLHCYHEKS